MYTCAFYGRVLPGRQIGVCFDIGQDLNALRIAKPALSIDDWLI